MALSPDKKPAHPATLEPTGADRDAVRAWYHAAPAAAPARRDRPAGGARCASRTAAVVPAQP